MLVVLLPLILLLSSLTACENSPTQPVATEITIPATATPDLSLPAVGARVCRLNAVPQAAEYVSSSGAEHKIYVIGVDDLPDPWNEDLPQNLKARSVEDLEAVLCIENQMGVESTSCGTYYDSVSGARLSVQLGFYSMDLKLVAAKTGKVIARKTIFSDLTTCPESIASNDPRLVNNVLYGDPITWETVWNNYYQDIRLAIVNATSIPPTPTSTPLPPGPSIVDWPVAVKEDFSDPTIFLGWELGPGETIADGVLTWHIQPTQLTYRSQAHDWTTFLEDDFYARLVVRHSSGSASDAYGLAFQMYDGKQLAFLIQDDGNFRIQNAEYSVYPLQASSAILPGEWNTLEVIGFQGKVYLYINEKQVFQFQEDDPYASGLIGLSVMVEENPDSTASSTFEFDEFEVRYP